MSSWAWSPCRAVLVQLSSLRGGCWPRVCAGLAESVSDRGGSGPDWTSLPSWRDGCVGLLHWLGAASWAQHDLGPWGPLGVEVPKAVTRIMSHTVPLPRAGACCCKSAASLLPCWLPQAQWPPGPRQPLSPFGMGPLAASAPAAPVEEQGGGFGGCPSPHGPSSAMGPGDGGGMGVCLPLKSLHSRQLRWHSAQCSSVGRTWGCWHA